MSCYACVHYYEDDGSCVKTSIIPSRDGNKTVWKNCKYFELNPKYMTNSFVETVRRVKGNNSLNHKSNHIERKVNKLVENDSALICDYEIGSWIKSDLYGLGRLIEVQPGKVVIDFQGIQRRFIYPDSFDNCQLFLVHPPTYMDDIDDLLDTEITAEDNDSINDNDLINENDSINEKKQCFDDNICIEKFDTVEDNTDNKCVQVNEDEKHDSSFIDRIIYWIKRFLGR